MNQTQNAGARRFSLYRILSVVIVAVAILLRTLNLLLFYEKDIGYYASGSILPVVMEAFVFLAVVFFALYALVVLRNEPPALAARTKSASVAALITAVALAIFTIGLFSAMSAGTASPYGTVLFVTGTLAMLYCLLFGLGKGTAVTSLVTALGLILWCGILLMESYFDVSVQMNAPAKLALHLGCIGGMLLMIGELRLVCGHAKPRLYAFSVSSATLFLGMASIPSVIADAFLRLPARDHALSDLVFFGLFLLGLSRLIVPGKAEPTAEEETETPVETSETPESPDDAEPQTESDETPAEPSQSKETT